MWGCMVNAMLVFSPKDRGPDLASSISGLIVLLSAGMFSCRIEKVQQAAH